MAAWRYIRNESLAIPLFALLLVIASLVPPVGNFPLNDDWIYAQTVQDILETGVYHGHPYADPLFLVHAYWGALVTYIFGFSFTVLRCSTLLLLWLAAWMASRCASELKADRGLALLVGVVFLANPLALNLGYTFMSDVPFLAVAHCSLYFFLRATRSQSVWALFVASIFAATSYFIRQFGLLVPMAFTIAQILLLLKRRQKVQVNCIAALVLPWIGVIILVSLLPESARGISPEFDAARLGNGVIDRVLYIAQHVLRSLTYIALFLLPMFVLHWKRPSITGKKAVGLFLLMGVGFWLLTRGYGSKLPYFGNMLYDLGVGPLTLRGIVRDGQLATPVQLGNLWWIPTILCGAVAIWWFQRGIVTMLRSVLITHHTHEETDPARTRLFLLLLSSAYLTVLVIPGVSVIYDRYLLMSLAPVALLVLPDVPMPRWKWRTAMACASVMMLCSIAFLQDYLAWNRARWEAWTLLKEQHGATPVNTDGGYEFHGWFTSDNFVTETTTPTTRQYGAKGGWVIDDRFAISFLERENFETIDAVPYFSWLGFEERDLLILRRVREDEY